MASLNFNTISGTIYDQFDAPAANLSVQLYDKDLRSEQLLGEALTDAKGFYSISYDGSKWVDSDAKSADVFIRVRVPAPQTAPAAGILGESPVYFNVLPAFTLDFKIGNTPIRVLNEFDALVQVIKPLAEPQKVALADLQENDKIKDISFLANETGEAATKIALIPIAFTLAGKTKIAPDIFYGLFRLQFPTDLNALLLTKVKAWPTVYAKPLAKTLFPPNGASKWMPSCSSSISRLRASFYPGPAITVRPLSKS